jgi:hypothetical protein
MGHVVQSTAVKILVPFLFDPHELELLTAFHSDNFPSELLCS